MNQRIIGWIALGILALFAAWIVINLLAFSSAGEFETVAEFVKVQEAGQARRGVNFIFAFLLASLTVILFAALGQHFRSQAPFQVSVSMVFLPAYLVVSTLLAVYLVTVIPFMTYLYGQEEYTEAVGLIMKQFMPEQGGALLGNIGLLPFGFLAIPALLLGWQLVSDRLLVKIAGILLMINGAGYLLGLLAIASGERAFRMANAIGALAFFLGLIILSIAFLRKRAAEQIVAKPSAEVA